MATVYSRTWKKSGKTVWYTKIKVALEWKPLLLKGVKSKTQAAKLADELEKARERECLGLETGVPFLGTFAELCAWAFDTHFRKKASAQPDGSRLRTHAGDPDKGTATWLGALPARRLKSSDFTRYLSELTEAVTVRGGSYSGTSINRIRANFSKVFEVARAHGHWIGPNPVEATDAAEEVKTSHDILRADEIDPVLAAMDPYWRGCFAVGILAALRKGEIFGLMKEDVDLARRVLKVRRSHGRNTTKGGTHEDVPIHAALVPYLEEWLDSPGPLLFPATNGKRRHDKTDMPRILQAAMVRAGFVDHYEQKCRRRACGYEATAKTDAKADCPECGMRLWLTPRARKVTWHEGTRHSSASHLLMNGASLATVQKILRHKEPTLTINTYGHLTESFLGEEVNRLPFGATSADAERTEATKSHSVEHPTSEMHSPSPDRGAPMVRGGRGSATTVGGKVTGKHQNGSDSSWRRRGLNSRPMHCESKAEVSPVVPPLHTASQSVEIPRAARGSNSTPLHRDLPRPAGRGAPMVRGRALAHHDAQNAKAGGPGRSAEGLLSAREVARRLNMSVGWVYRRIDSGDLEGTRAEPAGPLLVTEEALADYLQRFPGVAPPAPPEPPAKPAARARKGAA